MPTYLCHGFRWQRRSIRVYVVVQNLDDAAPEWTIKQGSARNLIESFYNLFDFLPECTSPPTRSSSRTPVSRSVSHQSISQSSMSQTGHMDDDDDASYHTTKSNRSRGRSASQSGSTATLHQQQSQTGEQPTPVSRRPSSNSSRKRSEAAGPSNVHGLSSRAALTYQNHHAPPSPPSSQPGFNLSSQPIDPDDPVLAQNWSPVKLLEEFDPANLEEVSRPYAYVADYVARISDSCSVVEEIQRYEARVRRDTMPPVTGASSDEMLNGKRDTTKLGRRAGWFEKLRDQLQRGEDIRWYVVVNGDEERAWPVDEAPGAGLRESLVHHKQYTQQQLIFEAQDRDLEMRREELRKELGYEQGGVDRLMERRLERRPNPPHKELPPLRTKISIMSQIVSTSPRTPKSPKTPKTPKSPKSPGRASLRKLFSRGKAEEETAT